MNIMDLISGQLDNQNVLNQLGKSADAEPSQVQQLVKLGLPALVQALGRNASTPAGADSLAKALDQHQEDPVDDIEGFLNQVDTQDGSKILQHTFSGNNERVQQNLAQNTGLATGQVANLLTQLAPLVLGVLGQQKKQQNLDASGVSGLLNSVLGQAGSSGLMDKVKQMLDSDHDGDIMDDVKKLLGGFMK
jgi:hypothetical protein